MEKRQPDMSVVAQPLHLVLPATTKDNRASARRMRSRTSFQATDLTACIICQTTQKKYKDKHLNESLSWCLTEQASATLLEAV